jgi:hypothetical protein
MGGVDRFLTFSALPPLIHDGPAPAYRRTKQLLAWGAAVQTASRRELFVAYDVCLTGWRESLLCSITQKISAAMYLSRNSLLPLALVVGLFGTPTLTPVHPPGRPEA